MNYIKDILKEKGLTVNDLAVRLGISRQALSKQIQGKMLVETAERIAVALEVPLWRLFLSRKEADEFAAYETVAFFYHKGKPTIPGTVDQIMPILREWNNELFYAECYRYTFDHLHQRYDGKEAIQKLIDSLCALLRENGDPYYVCKNKEDK